MPCFLPLPLRGLVVSALMCSTAAASFAQSATEAENGEGLDLGTLTVTSSAQGGSVYDQLSGSSEIGPETLQKQYIGSPLTQVLNGIPGVSTQTSANDPGIAINMRGLQDFGRVNVMVDGARQNFQKNGHGANGTFYLDPDMLKSVSVTRGPVSVVNGGGAIGGTVNFTTIDAEDIILPGETRGLRLRTGWSTNGEGPTVNLVGATQFGTDADGLLGGTFRDIGNYTSGNGREVQSSQMLHSGLAKFRWRPVEGQEMKLSFSRYDNDFLNTSTSGDTINNTATVDTYTFGYHFTQPGSDLWDLTANAYSTRTKFSQAGDGGSETAYSVRTTGFDLYNTARFDTGTFRHEITIGGDGARDQVHTDSNATPSGKRTAWGGYAQDRVLYDTWLEVNGALRYDAYTLKGTNDGEAFSTDGGRMSPKLTVGVTPWTPVTFYATYAEGYRAPSLTETLIDGCHFGNSSPTCGGRFEANPDLKPEIAHTIETGVNLRFADLIASGDSLGVKLDVFQNDVDDYIDTVSTGGFPSKIQYQNVARARIRGFEAEANYDSERYFGSLSGQYLDGEDRVTGDDLANVPPYRIVLTAGLHAFERRLDVGTRATVVGTRSGGSGVLGAGDSYQTVDLFADYAFSDRISGALALNNIFDRNYIPYLDTNESPGFNATASLTIRF